jgi:hypothetical protein
MTCSRGRVKAAGCSRVGVEDGRWWRCLGRLGHRGGGGSWFGKFAKCWERAHKA